VKSFAFAAVLLLPAVMGSNASRDAETTRVRTRLASVEQHLRRTDVSRLTPAQRAARARNLDVLHAYWVRGVFPMNTDFPGERMPYFVDRYGTRCAMAYLIEQSGHGDLVARVAATNNNARIRELKSDPELVAWLRDNGLTAAEAAHPPADDEGCQPGLQDHDRSGRGPERDHARPQRGPSRPRTSCQRSPGDSDRCCGDGRRDVELQPVR